GRSGSVYFGAARRQMGYGVIGSPTDSGSVSLGSSPGTPAPAVLAPSSSGLGRRPLKAVAPVRIRSGLRTKAHVYDVGLFACLWHADRRYPSAWNGLIRSSTFAAASSTACTFGRSRAVSSGANLDRSSTGYTAWLRPRRIRSNG